MEIEMLKDFFFWCMIINTAVYLLAAVGVQVMRGMLLSIHKRMFGMAEAAVMASAQRYLANCKLLITVFNFTPWLALVIIR